MKTVSEESSASAAELETPNSLNEAIETGFLPDDEHYRLTGEFKKETPAEKDAAPPAEKTENENESENDDASAASSSKAAPSESATQQREEKTVPPRENRWQKRERELRELKAENARLKTQPRTETRSETAQPSQAVAETKAAAEPQLDDVDQKTQKPAYSTFKEWQTAHDKWNRQEAIREFQELNAKSTRETQQQQAEREIGQSLIKKFEAPRAKYADFDKVALSDALTIPKGSVAEMFLLDSDHAGEVLYHLGKNPEILQGFYRDHDPKTGKFTSLITPQQQFRKLMAIEGEVSGTRAGTGENGDGRRESSSSSAKPVTQASRPAHQVDGKGTVAKDAVEQALDDGDFETYQRAQNAKELASRKRK